MNKILEDKRLELETLIFEGNIEKAIKKIAIAVRDYPEDDDLKLLYASALTENKQYKKSEDIINKTLKNNEKLYEKYYYLCINYHRSNNYKKFVDSFILSVKSKKDFGKVNSFFFNIINNPLTKNDYSYLNNKDIKNALVTAIELNLIPIDSLSKPIQQILIEDSKIKDENIQYIEKLSDEVGNSKKEKIAKLITENFSNSGKKLLLCFISTDCITNPYLEKLITIFRFGLLKIYSEEKSFFEEEGYLSDLLISLCNQNFLNHSSWIVSDIEKDILTNLDLRRKNIPKNKQNLNDFLMYGSYIALDKDKELKKTFIKKIPSNKEKFFTLKNHLTRSERLLKYKKNINTKFSITKEESLLLKMFQDENYGPSWGKLKTDEEIPFLYFLKMDLAPIELLKKPKDIKSPNILYAGCGTGRSTMKVSNIENCSIDAIDLSLENLLYFEEKCHEHRVRNINIYNMDFSDIKKLNKQYDLIFIDGVFNTTNNLDNNFDILSEILKDDGFVKLNMPSPLIESEKNLLQKKLIKKNISKDSPISQLRQFIFTSRDPDFRKLINNNDFYDKHSLNKLIFNDKKNLKNISEMKNVFQKKEFEYLGLGNFISNIDNKTTIMSLYKNHYKDDIFLKNLDNWSEFEEKYKIIFKNNYRFWLKKGKKK